MINAIVNGVIDTLAKAYPTYPVYEEIVEQGLKQPCFYVKEQNASVRRFLGERFEVNVSLCVHFIPKANGEAMTHIRHVRSALYDLLEVLYTEKGRLFLLDSSSQIVDSALLFFVTYRTYVGRKEVTDLMETLEEVDVRPKPGRDVTDDYDTELMRKVRKFISAD